MTKKVVFTLVLTIILTSCSPVEEAADTLNSANCLNTLLKLSENEDDLNCSELGQELNRLERDCSSILDASTKANIDLLRTTCED